MDFPAKEYGIHIKVVRGDPVGGRLLGNVENVGVESDPLGFRGHLSSMQRSITRLTNLHNREAV
jgi:hypothetical protein